MTSKADVNINKYRHNHPIKSKLWYLSLLDIYVTIMVKCKIILFILGDIFANSGKKYFIEIVHLINDINFKYTFSIYFLSTKISSPQYHFIWHSCFILDKGIFYASLSASRNFSLMALLIFQFCGRDNKGNII